MPLKLKLKLLKTIQLKCSNKKNSIMPFKLDIRTTDHLHPGGEEFTG